MLTKAVLSGLFLTSAMAQSANFMSWWQDALVVAARRTVLEKYGAETAALSSRSLGTRSLGAGKGGTVEGGKCYWTHRSDGYVMCSSMPSCETLETLKNVSVVECIQKCCENDKCMSVDWNKDFCHLKTQNYITAKTAGYWYQGYVGRFRHWSKEIENTVRCEDWCYTEIDCLEDPNDASCGACDMPECKAVTPEPTPAPTPRPEPGCEDWCYSEIDCLEDPNDAYCGACDMPECKVRCEDWCYAEIDCLEDPNDASCGACDMPECNVGTSSIVDSPVYRRDVRERPDARGHSLQNNATPECQVHELWVIYDFMQDVTTCDKLMEKYIEYAVQGKNIPECELGVSFVDDAGNCEDKLVAEARRIVLEKMDAKRKSLANPGKGAGSVAEPSASEPSASACADWCDPECRDNECCGGHEACMGCPIPGCSA